MQNNFVSIALVSASLSGVVSVVAYALGERLCCRNALLRNLGGRMLTQKLELLKKWPFSIYSQLVETKKHVLGGSFLAVAIFLKSLAALLLAPLFIFILPASFFVTPALVSAHGDSPDLRSWSRNVVIIQGASHYFAAAAGFAVYWQFYYSIASLRLVIAENLFAILVFTALSLLCAIWAGLLEADGHSNKNYLH